MYPLKTAIASLFTIAVFTLFVLDTHPLLGQAQNGFETIEFESGDGLKITADLYRVSEDQEKPFVILCHQAGWSRGEYREIAPKLNTMGFNCMAIDQRSGGGVNDVANETAKRAKAAGKKMTFIDAEQDMVAAVQYVRKNYAQGHLVLWGSSYSSALVLRVSSQHPDLVNGTLSFAPGEYFGRFGKPGDWIATAPKRSRVRFLLRQPRMNMEIGNRSLKLYPAMTRLSSSRKRKGITDPERCGTGLTIVPNTGKRHVCS